MIYRIVKTFTRPIKRGEFKTTKVVDGNIVNDDVLKKLIDDFKITSLFQDRESNISIQTMVMVSGSVL